MAKKFRETNLLEPQADVVTSGLLHPLVVCGWCVVFRDDPVPVH